MKELKIVLILLVIGFCSTGSATPKCPKTYFPNTIKGGLQTSQNHQLAKVAFADVEGKFEYHIQYIKFKLDHKNNEKKCEKKTGKKMEEEHIGKKSVTSPGCDRAKSL